MIAQYFPPAGGVGSFRVTKFVKYLRHFDWEPVVLTVREDCYPGSVWLDHDLERDIPVGVRIYRTPIWRSKIINDVGIRWLPFLIPALIKVIHKERPQVVYFTGGPFFPLIAGPIIKLLFRLPFVVDLRDPWRLARRVTPAKGIKGRLGRWLTNLFEPFVIRHALRVICVSKPMCDEYREAYKNLPSCRFVIITNGFDPEDFVTVDPVNFPNPTIVYAGKFRISEGFRDPTPFFEALKLVRERGYEYRFLHVGRFEQEIADLASQVGIRDLVEFVGPCSYRETLRYVKGANLVLLIGTGQRTEQTTKIFDYIGCGKPVLALASKHGELARIANEIPLIRLVSDRSPEAIASALEEFRLGVWGSYRDSHRNTLQKYHRRYLTGELANVLDRASLRE